MSLIIKHTHLETTVRLEDDTGCYVATLNDDRELIVTSKNGGTFKQGAGKRKSRGKHTLDEIAELGRYITYVQNLDRIENERDTLRR